VLASRSGKALATRKGRVRVRVAVFFTPFGGTRQSAKATVTLIRPAR
jgi:hypothetical protein